MQKWIRMYGVLSLTSAFLVGENLLKLSLSLISSQSHTNPHRHKPLTIIKITWEIIYIESVPHVLLLIEEHEIFWQHSCYM
jgi:hypothetical protein